MTNRYQKIYIKLRHPRGAPLRQEGQMLENQNCFRMVRKLAKVRFPTSLPAESSFFMLKNIYQKTVTYLREATQNCFAFVYSRFFIIYFDVVEVTSEGDEK